MIGTSARPDQYPDLPSLHGGPIPPPPVAAARGSGLPFGLSPVAVGGLALLMLVVGVGAGLFGMSAIVATSPPAATFNVADGARDVPLASDVQVSITGWNTQLEHAALFRAELGPDGQIGAEQSLPVQASILRQSGQTDGTEVALKPGDGALLPDSRYRLVVKASGLVAGGVVPRPETVEREVRFTTLRSPTPRPQAAPLQMAWGQPLQIQWDSPIDSVGYKIEPPTAVRTQVDPNNRQVSALWLENPADGQTYTVTVAEARGANGLPLRNGQAAPYTVVAPKRPALLDADEPITTEIGKPVSLRWSQPMDRLKVQSDPPLTVNWAVDRKDPQLVQLTVEGLAQGTTYELTFADAYAKGGAPAAEPPTVTLQTPGRLMVEDWDLGVELGQRVPAKTKPVIIFEQPIRDRKAALSAISMEPNVPGKWDWLDDRRVQFTPTKTLPFDAEVTIKIKPGQGGARSVAGSYFENEAILSFVTEEDKLIDVDVTRQMMTLYEKGKVVRTFKVATGVPGADTPLGEFNVEYKMPTARFQGTNVNGSRYDIPDVHWVLAFMGDYTIHGSYWRSGFGAPASNGCVSLSDDDAKVVFDWAPDGTRIKIHY
ncbi:MAG: L,D-transpeptidase family protein [Chloroflexi bacterium]|nr:L,D-transpeptidase family protein [Chloroflexota bacterium]